MKNKILSTLLLLVLSLSLFSTLLLPSLAYSDSDLLNDKAELLSASQRSALLETLREVSEKYDCIVAVYTVQNSSTYYETAAKQIAKSLGEDVILLYIDMKERGYTITSRGKGYDACTDRALDYIEDSFVSDLSDGDYFDAFRHFAKSADRALDYNAKGKDFRAPYPFFQFIIIALIVGLVAGLIYTTSLKKQLKSVKKQTEAGNYVTPGSLSVTTQKDIYLYRTVTRTAKPKNTSSGGGGSHRSGGTRSGRF